ncbi:capsid protein [Richelia intracellularis HH01]|uniref:Capsid protein n=1 Tax=Richelia intracellularis HH01 TaxID=1165094 RepID=M1WS61_9NOST|nr:capsid protein [Richelia intracellularis HH01]
MTSGESGLLADLSQATSATINAIRNSFQIQRLLERDARGGTRYTEIVRSHFGVISPDARLQRPEYLGGGSAPITVNPIAQTSASTVTGSDTPLGALGAVGTGLANGHGFSTSFTEHGVILGLASVRADLTYQQGLHRMWSRQTRYDFYFPVFAHLGEQAVLNKEIYCDGTANDSGVFGYQERWAEYRYKPSQVTGLMRSTSSGTLDAWHLAQNLVHCQPLTRRLLRIHLQ